MGNKKLLTLDDLYNYYTSNFNSSVTFNSKDAGQQIIVQTEGIMKYEDSDDSIEGLLPVVLQANHIDINNNHSYISEDVNEKALPSFKLRPILGFIHEVDGQPEFYAHNMHYDDDGNIIYDEVPVGVVKESVEPKLVYDKDKGKTYAVVEGYIYEEYSKAAEIIRREQKCPVSVELSIRQLSYNAKDKILNIEDFYYNGVTILGKNDKGDDVLPGMEGANIKIEDFSAKNNSVFSDDGIKERLVETLDKINQTLSNFNIKQDLEKGGSEGMTKLETLLEKYGKTTEDLNFDYENLSDEELELKFKEEFEVDDASNEDESDDNSEQNSNDDSNNGTEDFSDNSEPSANPEPSKFNVQFELSFDEIGQALNALCSPYRNDNEWCYVQKVYDNYFIMYDWDNDKFYKQSYLRDEDNISLSGERIEVFAMLLTESEKISIESMRENYSIISEKLAAYEKAELNAKKDAIFADEAYLGYLKEEPFVELQKNKEQYSLEELADKCEIAFAKCVKKNKNFSLENKEKEEPKKPLRHTFFDASKGEGKKKPYGNIFK